MTLSRLACVITAFFAFAAYSLAQEAPSFYEFSALAGGFLKPADYATFGLSAAVGSGKYSLGIEARRELLSNYGLGVGLTADPNAHSSVGDAVPSSNFVSDSRVDSFGGYFRRDVSRLSRQRFAAYGLAGISFVRARSVDHYTQAQSSVAFGVSKRAHTVGFSLGAGVRIPLWNGLGVRAEGFTQITPPADSTYFNGYFPLPGPRLKTETFVGLNLVIYYRHLNRHL